MSNEGGLKNDHHAFVSNNSLQKFEISEVCNNPRLEIGKNITMDAPSLLHFSMKSEIYFYEICGSCFYES